MKNMSRGRKKNFSSAITIQFTVDEKKKLDEIAAKDRRTLSGEIVWLIENYHNGNLDDVQKIVVGVERAMRDVIASGGNPFHVHPPKPTKVCESGDQCETQIV